MPRQYRLKLEQTPSFSREDFIVSPANEDALRQVESWPSWPGKVMALTGPEGAGKTHLATIWSQRTHAIALDPRRPPDIAALTGHAVWIDNADCMADDEALFHLINMAAQDGGGLLLTARTPPRGWTAALPDLRSRLNALPVVEVAEPDDAVLLGVVRKLFRERNIRPTEDTYPYLLRRMERSVAAARKLVKQLDEAADSLQRPVSRALAKEVLEAGDPTMDLF